MRKLSIIIYSVVLGMAITIVVAYENQYTRDVPDYPATTVIESVLSAEKGYDFQRYELYINKK